MIDMALRSPSKLIIILAAMIMSSCRAHTINDLPGRYDYVSYSGHVVRPAQLYIYKNGSYKFCDPACAIGSYTAYDPKFRYDHSDRIELDGPKITSYIYRTDNVKPTDEVQGNIHYGLFDIDIDLDVLSGDVFEKKY